MKLGRWLLFALVLIGAGAYAARRYQHYQQSAARPFDSTPAQPEVVAPPGVRIKVEVLNATKIRGLARRATAFLRDRGFDVVAIGTAPEQRDATLVLDRSNHPDWAQLVARAFRASVEQRLDTLRYLDVTVLVGSDWRPPPLPFYP